MRVDPRRHDLPGDRQLRASSNHRAGEILGVGHVDMDEYDDDDNDNGDDGDDDGDDNDIDEL